MITMEQIRNAYPSPKRAQDNLQGVYEYCVGGAACQMIHMALASIDLGRQSPSGFPEADVLAEFLEAANPLLNLATAGVSGVHMSLATEITHANDRGDFAEAWRLLDVALTYLPV